jgi:dihydrofolate reductase
MIKIIVAQSNNRVIGKDNKLLWRQSDDLKRFKSLTLNNKVVMGRKTFESIGKPLPNRENYVLTRNNIEIDGCKILNHPDDVLDLKGDIFIIGGGEIYKKFLNLADEIYLTQVDCELDGDTFFPPITNDWKVESEEKFKKDNKNQYDWRFIKLIRNDR